jgi:hypothetical protein
MTKKTRRTITLSPHVDQWLDRDDVNASGLINRLVAEYKATQEPGSSDPRKDAANEIREQELTKVRSILLDGRNAGNLDPDNPAVMTHANRLGLTPQELIDRLSGNTDE